MPKAVDIIRAEHQSMTRLLDLLYQQIDLFEEGNQPDYELLQEIVDYFLTYPDLYHHPKEDMIFRRIKKRLPDQVEDMFDLEAEHEQISERLRVFARALANVMLEGEVPRDQFVPLAREFLDGERKHMAYEESHFLQLALDTLNDEDWKQVDAKVARISDPLSKEQTTQFSIITNHLNG